MPVAPGLESWGCKVADWYECAPLDRAGNIKQPVRVAYNKLAREFVHNLRNIPVLWDTKSTDPYLTTNKHICYCRSEADCTCPKCRYCGHVVDGHKHWFRSPLELRGIERYEAWVPGEA